MPPLRESDHRPQSEAPAPLKGAPKRGDRIATLAFRVFAGLFGLAVLVAFYWMKKNFQTCLVIGGFCGLTLGYAFGGDKWGARLFGWFTGHRVQLPPEPDRSPDPDPKK
jgi:hypothetical protein